MKAYGVLDPHDLEFGVSSKDGKLKSSHRRSVRRYFAKKARRQFIKKLNKGWDDA